MPTLPADAPQVFRRHERSPLHDMIRRDRAEHSRRVEALALRQAEQNALPPNTILQKTQAPYGYPGYSPLTGFSFTPSTYQGLPNSPTPPSGPMSSTDYIRLGGLIHGPGASGMYAQAYGAGGDGNSAVFACLQAICLAYPQAPARVYK